MSKRKLVDQRVFDLAEHFVGDGPKGSDANRRCCDLAEDLQTYIEDWIEYDDRAKLRVG
jgi:hypothetical protein